MPIFLVDDHLSCEILSYNDIYPISRFSHWFLPFFVCTLVTKIMLKEIVAFVAILNKERKSSMASDSNIKTLYKHLLSDGKCT